jgi:acetyl esterase/lipase
LTIPRQREATLLDESLDPEIRTGLAQMPELVFSDDTLDTMRQFTAFEPSFEPGIERVELSAGNVRLTLLRPSDARGDHLPALYWMHGGGLLIGNRHMDDPMLNGWCRAFSCVCATVEYALAPESAYPGAIDDCDAGLRHVFDHATELGIDPRRIGVGGRSAGGGLAAALALRDRDRGDGRIAFQYLEYPMLDDRQQTPSSRLHGLPMWSRESNTYAWRSYLAGRYGTDDVPADAAPARASDLTGLPSTFISVGTADGFRDEAIGYAARLARAGVMTELHAYAGAIHGFHLFADSAVVRCAVRDSDSWLGRQLAPGSRGTTGIPSTTRTFD